MGRPGVLAFWFGEPDEVTPEFIRQRRHRMRSTRRRNVLHAEPRHSPSCAQAHRRVCLAACTGRLRAERIAVTSSGMSALMLATQALVGPGDRVVAVTPLWPNLVEIPKILGARRRTACRSISSPRGWPLDLDRLLARADAGHARAEHQLAEQPDRLDARRATSSRRSSSIAAGIGIWIIADDAYERLYYGGGDRAPSFLDLADADDRVVSTNTFSKSWLMTGWRLGWIVAPAALMSDLGKLIEYNTSCAPVFVQRAGVVAVTRRRAGGRAHASSASARRAISSSPRLQRDSRASKRRCRPARCTRSFASTGMTDSLDFCKRLVREAGLGLAPGIAFGPEGEGFVRWCFAASEERLADGLARLERWMADTPNTR